MRKSQNPNWKLSVFKINFWFTLDQTKLSMVPLWIGLPSLHGWSHEIVLKDPSFEILPIFIFIFFKSFKILILFVDQCFVSLEQLQGLTDHVCSGKLIFLMKPCSWKVEFILIWGGGCRVKSSVLLLIIIIAECR